MTIEAKLALNEEDIRSFSKKMNEGAWMSDFRVDAFAQVEQLSLPKPDKTKIERWNFTDFPVHSVESSVYEKLDELPSEIRLLVDEKQTANLYIQHNNTPAYLSLSEDLAAKGVIFTDIFTASREHGELLKKYYMTDGVKVDEHKLSALNAAFTNGGAFIYVPKNVVVEQPIQALYYLDNDQVSLFNHVIIVADTSSSVTYIENYISAITEAKGQVNIISEVFAKDNAQVTYGAVDTLPTGFTTYVNRRGTASRDSRIDWALGMMNDSNTISENRTNLMGNGSYCDAKSVVIGRGKQRENFTTEIIHYGKDTEGHILKHGVVKDESIAIFNGIGKITNGAIGSNAVQESRILMLSDRARGDANPILLIEEDEVTAGHAASVGRMDPLQMFYLMSRGITKEDAERLVIHGFLAPVVDKLTIESVKKQLTEVIERKVR